MTSGSRLPLSRLKMVLPILAVMGAKTSKTGKRSPSARAKEPLRQVGALAWRRRKGTIEILLVTSRTTRRWVIPKGGVMAHLVDMNAARQEAFEEAGIAGRMQRKSIGTYRYRKIDPDGLTQTCVAKVFALEVQRELTNWPEMRQRRRRWFAVKEAVKRVGERDLRKIMRVFAAGL